MHGTPEQWVGARWQAPLSGFALLLRPHLLAYLYGHAHRC